MIQQYRHFIFIIPRVFVSFAKLQRQHFRKYACMYRDTCIVIM